MSEMEALRQRVKELQEARSLSTEEVEELLNVRQRVLDIASSPPVGIYLDEKSKGMGTTDQLMAGSNRSSAGGLASVSEGPDGSEELQGRSFRDSAQHEVEKLQELRSRLKKLQSMGSIDDDGLLELLDLRDRILNVKLSDVDGEEQEGESSQFVPYLKKHGKGSVGRLTPMQDEDTDGMSVVSRPNSSPAPGEDGYYHRIGSHRDLTAEQEIQMLRAQNAHMRQALESYAELPPFNHHMSTNGFEHAYMETAVPDSSISYSHDMDAWSQRQRSGRAAEQSSGKLRSRLGRKLSRAFSWRKRDKPNKFLMDYQTTEDEDVPNIVILNSLTHDQLLELLKTRHAQRSDSREGTAVGMRDAETGSQYGTSQSVRSMASSGMDTSTTIGMDVSGVVDVDHEESIRDLEVV